MEKVHSGYPILFSILHVCASFHHNRTNNKDFIFLPVRSPQLNYFEVVLTSGAHQRAASGTYECGTYERGTYECGTYDVVPTSVAPANVYWQRSVVGIVCCLQF